MAMGETISVDEGFPTLAGGTVASKLLPDVPSLLGLRRHLSIVHHLPGRIRLRVGRGLQGLAAKIDGMKGLEMLGDLHGIGHVRVNKAAGSILIEYDPETISPESWETLVRGDVASADAVLRHWLCRASRPHQQVDRSTR